MALDRLLVASSNAGKLREIGEILAPLRIQVLSQRELGIPEAPEPHDTFVENALAKARHAAARSGLPALADDSGLCVDALGGEPGVRSARFAGEPKDDERNNAHLVQVMRGRAQRSAHYYCVMVLVRHPKDPEPLIAEGRWYGEIIDTPRGAGGFGYDPYFLVPALGRTAAELQAAEKHAISHRGQAMARLLGLLDAALSPR
jgi:XTP/dITP diphosphohydrolase